MGVEEIHQDLKEIRLELRQLRQEITKYKGFVGGVMWAFAALSATLTFVFGLFQGPGERL